MVLGQSKSDVDRPDVFWLERAFLADDAPFVRGWPKRTNGRYRKKAVMWFASDATKRMTGEVMDVSYGDAPVSAYPDAPVVKKPFTSVSLLDCVQEA